MEQHSTGGTSGLILTAISWLLTGASIIAQYATAIPIILSCGVSVMAIRHYYYATKKLKQ